MLPVNQSTPAVGVEENGGVGQPPGFGDSLAGRRGGLEVLDDGPGQDGNVVLDCGRPDALVSRSAERFGRPGG